MVSWPCLFPSLCLPSSFAPFLPLLLCLQAKLKSFESGASSEQAAAAAAAAITAARASTPLLTPLLPLAMPSADGTSDSDGPFPPTPTSGGELEATPGQEPGTAHTTSSSSYSGVAAESGLKAREGGGVSGSGVGGSRVEGMAVAGGGGGGGEVEVKEAGAGTELGLPESLD